ncbi:hypothetical protein ABT282_08110 [Streptomyces sp. NPDC000927]|uniref:hypothetical protein n=1 Tax=Streptomyces sp. NPDC000927 TaxID=3154371 RepID=UPI00331D6236
MTPTSPERAAMRHPMLEDGFKLISYDLDQAVERIAETAGLPEAERSHPWYAEGGPAARQLGYHAPDMEETFVFDLAGMSLENTADRFLLWSGEDPEGSSRLVYVASSFTASFMKDLRARRPGAEIHFLHIPENSEGFEVFTDKMAASDQPGDDALDNLLMQQKRPMRPSDLKSARELVEGYVAKALERDMSPPEARVEATRVCAWLEAYAREAGRLEVQP